MTNKSTLTPEEIQCIRDAITAALSRPQTKTKVRLHDHWLLEWCTQCGGTDFDVIEMIVDDPLPARHYDIDRCEHCHTHYTHKSNIYLLQESWEYEAGEYVPEEAQP